VFSDKEDIFSYEKYRESMQEYAQRTTDIVVTEAGLQAGVRTYIIMPPTIIGIGSGFFNTLSIQVPLLIRQSIISGYVGFIGNGANFWNHVHISDLAGLYELIITKILNGDAVPFGPKGIYFAEAGEHSWRQLSEGIARAGVELGVLTSAETRSITLSEAADQWLDGNLQIAELGFAST
jgi:nucleoside-diphosphate-sugar epimerase